MWEILFDKRKNGQMVTLLLLGQIPHILGSNIFARLQQPAADERWAGVSLAVGRRRSAKWGMSELQDALKFVKTL